MRTLAELRDDIQSRMEATTDRVDIKQVKEWLNSIKLDDFQPADELPVFWFRR